MDTKTTYLWTVICPKKLTLAHNVFEVTELCRTRVDILRQNKILNVEVIALICGQKKGQSLSSKTFPKIGLKATIVF